MARLLPLLSWVAAAAVATGTAAAAPDDLRPVRLGDVVALALAHSPTLGAAIADVDYARGNLLSARGLDDPLLEASGAWNESRHPIVAGTPVQTTAIDDVLGWLQLTQPIPTGGRIGLRLSNDWTRSEFQTQDPTTMMFSPSASTVWAPSLQLVFSHSLLRGLGLHVARAPRFRAAALRDQATGLRAASAAVLLRDVVTGYWELAYARAETEIRRALAASARDQLAIVEANIGVGKQPPSASAEVKVAIALRDEEALLAADVARQRSLELQRLVGLPLDASAGRLSATDAPPPPEALPPVDELLDEARRQNAQLAAARAATRAAAVDVEVTRNGVLPQLDVSFSGGPQGNAADPSTAFAQLGHFSAFGVGASLTFSEPIPNRTARGLRQAAEALLHKATLTATDIELQIEAAVLRLASQLETARGRLEVLAPATEQASLDLEAERARFAVGRATNFDVLRRQEELANARLRQARARIDYAEAVAALGAVTNEILDRYQVVFR